MPCKYVLLDADGTLFDFSKAERYAIRQILRDCGIEDPNAEEVYSRLNLSLWKKLEKGLVTPERLKVQRFEEFFALYGIDRPANLAARQFLDGLAASCFVLPQSLGVLQELKRRNLRTAIVTNGYSRIQRRRLAASGLAPYVDAMVVSEELGVQKPDPAMIDHALRCLGCSDKSEALLVGDSLSSDMAAAANAGIRGVWYAPQEVPGPDSAAFSRIGSLRDLIALL